MAICSSSSDILKGQLVYQIKDAKNTVSICNTLVNIFAQTVLDFDLYSVKSIVDEVTFELLFNLLFHRHFRQV